MITMTMQHGHADIKDPSLNAVAEERPLYVRLQPKRMEKDEKGASRFLENTMDKWWLNPEHSDLERCYFKHITTNGESHWIFRNSKGEWWSHGIFG